MFVTFVHYTYMPQIVSFRSTIKFGFFATYYAGHTYRVT